MRHRKSGKKLGRNTSHRKAMMRNMVTSFFDHEKITTTDARAKELRKMAEKLITMARRGDLHSRRLVMQVISDKKIVAKLFDTIAEEAPAEEAPAEEAPAEEAPAEEAPAEEAPAEEAPAEEEEKKEE
jgi:ribosomal protein L17